MGRVGGGQVGSGGPRPGRAGGSLAGALGAAGWRVERPVRRGDEVTGAAAGVDLLVIATPDGAIATVASAVAPGEAVVAGTDPT